MAIEKEKQKEILRMILKKTAFGTIIGLGAFAGLVMKRRNTLAAIALGYCIGMSMQNANQELIKQLH